MSGIHLISAAQLRHIAQRMQNIDKHELVDAGIMTAGEGGNDWKRFNDHPMLFVCKLDDEKLDRLARLVN